MSDELLNDVHKRIMDSILRKGGGTGPNTGNAAVQEIIQKDQNLRKAVAELFFLLEKLNDPRIAIELLADHIVILTEMINQFRTHQR